MAIIPLVYSEPLLQAGYNEYIQWDTEAAPHIAVSGVTGSGKTYCVKLILAKISKYIPTCHMTLVDYKGDVDFEPLAGCERFFRYASAMDGLNQFYTTFTEIQKSGKKNDFHLLCFDEWASFINSLDKKEAEEAKKKLSNLLMLGRSFDFHVLLSQQRLDAESFGKSRDNFNLQILLGNPSKEVVGMLLNDFKEFILPDRTRGTGYLTNNGKFEKIVVPRISSMDNVDSAIKEAVMR